MDKHNNEYTPSELYRMRRPEYFSDSEVIIEKILPREVLEYELSQISVNQKQDLFETLARKLSEKFITPNLIPQVGPTGGGDGKTDSETYPVSEVIANRWFIPENSWKEGEKWAFAFSSKEDWKNKAKSDIEKIINTNRDYTKIFFITNRKPSSKKKKDAQDEFSKKYGLEITILDGEWIIEKIYNNNLINLAIDSLNLSNSFRNKIQKGPNDISREQELTDLENKINNSKRYFEIDLQLFEDTLESAILSRMLERSRDEIEGKFLRVFRVCQKMKLSSLWIRFYYQKAWTYIHWYDDYECFIEEFKNLKKLISVESSSYELELYDNLFNLLRGLSFSKIIENNKLDISFDEEKNDFHNILEEISNQKDRQCTALIAKTYKYLDMVFSSKSDIDELNKSIDELKTCVCESENFIEYPFEIFKDIFELLGKIYSDNKRFDSLIDSIAEISQKRNSELTAGKIFQERAFQKLSIKSYKDSIIYFGKSLLKLAKEESQYELYQSLIGLSKAYSFMGLYWVSNSCLISASSICFKQWFESGRVTDTLFLCAKNMAINELIIGRIPQFLLWFELFNILINQSGNIDDDDLKNISMLDGCLSVRIINSSLTQDMSLLPDILNKQGLLLSEDSCLYLLGQINHLRNEFKDIDLERYFKSIYFQDIKSQFLYETNLINNDYIKLNSIILGCNIEVTVEKDLSALLFTETLLALFESYFSTSTSDVYPNSENIYFLVKENPDIDDFILENEEYNHKYQINYNKDNYSTDNENFSLFFIEIISRIFQQDFVVNDFKSYIESLYKNEELNERLSLIYKHRIFFLNIFGDKPKCFLHDWKNSSDNIYDLIREKEINFENTEKEAKNSNFGKLDNTDNVSHNKRSVSSIINVNLWNNASWKGFGFLMFENQMGLILAYENIEFGKKIFDEWITEFGSVDRDETIRIAIIQGISKDHPYWYRVHITKGFDDKKEKNKLIVSTSRFHEMTPETNNNLMQLKYLYSHYKEFKLYPAKMNLDNSIEPSFEKHISKKELIIRNAWEIGINDIDSIAILPNDNPIIPIEEKTPPVIELIKKKRDT